MFSIKTFRRLGARVANKRRSTASCEGLEGRQLMTRGFLPSLPLMSPPGTATSQVGAWRSWGGPASSASATTESGARAGRPGGPLGDQVSAAWAGATGGVGAARAMQGMSPIGTAGARPRSFARNAGGQGFGGPAQAIAGEGPSLPVAPVEGGGAADPAATPGQGGAIGAVADPTGVSLPVFDGALDQVGTPHGAPLMFAGFSRHAATEAPAFPGAPPISPAGLDPSAQEFLADPDVQEAMSALRGAVEEILASGRPTHASVGALMDDLEAIADGTLEGDEAQARLDADLAAILGSAGATQEQVDDVLAKTKSLRDAVEAAGGDPTTLPPLIGFPGGPGAMQAPSMGQPGPAGPRAFAGFGSPFGGPMGRSSGRF